jgi:aryl-alcohol dehydrogenase-like predicted oxidoreductase
VHTRQLGEFLVTALGSGDLSLPTSAARGVPARDVEHALHEALSFGITLFDVAADSDSERFAGVAIREQRARDRVVIATKVPPLPAQAGAPRRDQLPERLPAAYVQQRVEEALRATRLDALALAQLGLEPAWLGSTAWPELVGTCARLVREGKVRHWGAMIEQPDAWLADGSAPPRRTVPAWPVAAGAAASSLLVVADEHTAVAELLRQERGEPAPAPEVAAAGPAHAAAALIGEPWLAALSVIYQLCDQRAAPLFALAAARTPPLAILIRQPLAGGALAGTLGPGLRLPPRDERHVLDDAALTRIAVGVARLSKLVKHAPVAAQSCVAAVQAAEQAERSEQVACADVAELALRFAIDAGGIALPRLHRRAHLMPAIAAASAPPLPAELVEIASRAVR